MTIEALLARWGLPAIVVGAGIEGETTVVAGGIIAHQGLVPLWGAMAAAVAGSFLADQLFFHAGRHWREHRLVRRLIGRPLFARALAAFERHPSWFILGFRFLYGLRTISPVAIGTTQVSTRLFVTLNLVAAAVWGTGFTLVGYAFGRGVEALAGRVRPELVVLGALATVLLVVGAVRWWRGRTR